MSTNSVIRFIRYGLATCVVSVIGIAMISASAAAADKRVALVIGNAAYTTVPALENPSIDAHAVAAALKRLGFTVIEGYDLKIADMRDKLRDFADQISDARAAVLYYAGHGVSVDEDNFLLPTDIVLKSASDLNFNAVNLSTIMKEMKRDEHVNLIILDACRDNPFAKELQRTARRSAVADRGLSPPDATLMQGTMIAFATDPKSTALDGPAGEDSPFTRALLRHMETPGISISTVMDRVRADVYEDTNKRQMPWVNTSIIGEFMLNPAPMVQSGGSAGGRENVAMAVPAPDRMAQETRLWDSAERGNSIEDYKAYLDAYPTGVYAQMAKGRIERLRGGGQATFAPAALGSTTAPAPGSVVTTAPTISPEKLKAEVGTTQTEKALALDAKARAEIQRRLDLLSFPPGATNGTFTDKTRAAIAEWQKSHQVPPTTFLGPLQYAALKEESEAQYQRFLSAQPMTPQERSLRPAGPAKVSPQIKKAQVARQPRPAGPDGNPLGSVLHGIGAGLGNALGNKLFGR